MKELQSACQSCEGLSDWEFVTLNAAVCEEAARGRSVLHNWLRWTLINFPNFQVLPRLDLETGRPALVSLQELNKLEVWNLEQPALAGRTGDAASFGSGRFACPAQTLARASMLLTLRILFSPSSPIRLKQCVGGRLDVAYAGVLSELFVTWTDDSIPREAISSEEHTKRHLAAVGGA